MSIKRDPIEHSLGCLCIFLVSYKQQSVPLYDQDLSVRLVILFLGIKSLKSLSSIYSFYFIEIIDRLPSEGFLLWGLKFWKLRLKNEKHELFMWVTGQMKSKVTPHFTLLSLDKVNPHFTPPPFFVALFFNLLCLLYHLIVLHLG